MTLIITAFSDNLVVEVSDRRLTWSDGRIEDEFAIKAVCVGCVDASFSIAFTGLAEVDGQRTDEWLVDYLASIDAGCLTFQILFDSLHKYVSASFIKLRRLGINRRITFALAGFGVHGPFGGFLSNIEDNKGNRLTDIDEDFQRGFIFRNSKEMHQLDLMINGAEGASKIFDAAIPTCRKRYFNETSDKIEAALVQLIRKASTDPKEGKWVGRNCLSTVINPNGEYHCQDYPEVDSPQRYTPHLIFCGKAYKGIKIWVGDGAPSWWTGEH